MEKMISIEKRILEVLANDQLCIDRKSINRL